MKIFNIVLLCSFAIASSNAAASIVVGGTRVVFDGSKDAATISVENTDKVTNLVQSWFSTDNSTLAKGSIIITPPLFRLEAGKKATLRMVRSGLPVAEDKESMIWLNIKGIPATSNDVNQNTMQIAVNSKIKFIYRPKSLKEQNPERSAQQVTWEPTGSGFVVNNPTPFYMNFASVVVNNKPLKGQYYVAPDSKLQISVQKMPAHGSVKWAILNDYGVKGPEKITNY